MSRTGKPESRTATCSHTSATATGYYVGGTERELERESARARGESPPKAHSVLLVSLQHPNKRIGAQGLDARNVLGGFKLMQSRLRSRYKGIKPTGPLSDLQHRKQRPQLLQYRARQSSGAATSK